MKTLIKVLYLILTTFFALPVQSQIIFEKMIPGTHNNYGNDVIQTQDSGYVVCGTDGYYNYQWPNWGLTLIKTDKYGTVKWQHNYYSTINNAGYSVQQTTDGGLIACGYSEESGYHYLLVRTDSTGELIWNRIYDYHGVVSGAFWDSYSVKQCYDQGFILCSSFNSTSTTAALLIRTDVIGDTLWEKIYQSEYNELGKSVICLPDSGFIMLGVNDQPSTKLRKLDQYGEPIWDKGYTCLLGNAFERTDENGFIICGNVSPNQIGLLKTNQDGDSLWFKTFSYHADANSVGVTTDGGYLIGGTIYDSPTAGLNQLFLLRTDANGNLLWTRKFGGSLMDIGKAVKTTFDTGFIFAGTTTKPGTDTAIVYLIKVLDDDTLTGKNIEYPSGKELVFYPNPTNGILNINFNEPVGDVYLEVNNLFGTCIFKDLFRHVKEVLSVQIPIQNTGLYLVSIRTQKYLRTGKIFLKCLE